MYIVDYQYVNEQKESSKKFDSEYNIAEFALENSFDHAGFRITRINKYETGELIPHEIVFKNGRIDIKKVEV